MKPATRLDKIKKSVFSLFKGTVLDPDFYREVLRFTRSVLRNFALTMTCCAILFSIIYFTAFHGECSMRLVPGSGGTAYRQLYMREQYFFNVTLSKRAWYDLAENTPDFDSSGYNGGLVIRWRGFGYIWKWEEPIVIVF